MKSPTKKILFGLILVLPAKLFAQTLTMTSPSVSPVVASIGVPLSFTCQVSAPPANRIWGTGVIKHYSSTGGDITIGTFTLPAAFQTSGGTLTTSATFTYLPTGTAATSDAVRCLFKTGNGWNEPFASTTKPVTLSASVSDTTAPSIPSGLTASNLQQTTATLSWTAASDNVGVTGYDVSINSGTAIAVTGTSYSAIGLTAATTYNFKVRAKDAAGNLSAYSSTVNFTTASAPSGTNSVAVLAPAPGSLITIGTPFTYTCSTTQASGSDIYNIQFFAVTNAGNTWTLLGAVSNSVATNPGNVSISATFPASIAAGTVELKCLLEIMTGSVYSNPISASGYNITAVAGSGSGDTTAPSIPSGLAANPSQTTAALSWSAATDNVGVTGYEVSINAGAAITVSGTSYSATGLAASTTYNFKVRAKDGAGNFSAYSSVFNFTTAAASSGAVTIPFYYGANAAVQLSATVQSSPASITLNWANVTSRSVSSIVIYRKLLTATSWGSSIATPSSSATSYTDTGVSLNTLYEYKVVINGSANGYIASGINANVDEYKGKILLIVDSTIEPSITNDLKTLRRDLYGDGWIPLPVQTVARTASPASVRAIIQTAKTANADLKAVYLIGHVPAPYVGNNNPDGHAARVMGGDGYYAELDSTWNTSGCANNSQQAVLNETPSASNMICNSNFPSTVELQSGRVDMYNLPSFSMNEVSLIQNYLSKAHSFKIKQISPIKRALIKDTFNANGWTNAAGVWGTLPSLVGINNVVVDNSSTTYTYNLLNNQSYLFNYGTGFGASCQGSNSALIGSTSTAASTSWDGIFNMVFGSYFGEYNCQDSFLRGVLGSGDALANVYNSYNWYFHRMAMGQTIGDGALQTMNNAINGTYPPLGNDIVGTSGNTHESLMGDPSLRMEYIAPPTNLVTTASQISWTASAEGSITGYHVYEVLGSNITRLTATPVTGTSYSTTTAGRSFIVRAVKLVNGASGSFYLPSVGAITSTLVP